MAQLYRKSSLEKLSNPEQLDRAVKVSSPLSWLALLGILIVIAATIIWAVFGSIPTISTEYGMIINSEDSYAVCADNSGTVTRLNHTIGSRVNEGDTIAVIENSLGEVHNVTSELSGVVSELTVSENAEVYPGTDMCRITPDGLGEQLLICYVAYSGAKRFEPGMSVAVYPSHVDSRNYGHMEATIVNVGKYAVDTSSMGYILGINNLLAEQFVSSGPVVAMLCKITTDNSSESGFYWTNDKGDSLTIENGTLSSVQIVISEDAPITKLFG